MGKRICRKYWYFDIFFHLIMCFHFKLQLCHLRMFSRLLVNTSSKACFIRERRLFLFDSRDHSGFCSMIMTMGTEPPSHCHHVQVMMRSEEFPHITSSQTFHALHTTLDSKMHLYKDHGAKNHANSIWEDTRLVFCQQIRLSNWTVLEYRNNFRPFSSHLHINHPFVDG